MSYDRINSPSHSPLSTLRESHITHTAHSSHFPFTRCSHGDMLYLIVKTDNETSEVKGHIEEDEVDKVLSKKDGQVGRERDPQL